MIAYLVNQYPKISHTFIRREIRALERRGVEIARYSVRSSGEELSDPEDAEEARVTTTLLHAPRVSLARAVERAIARDPTRFAAASRVALRLARREGRRPVSHAAYLVEACYLRERLEERGCRHVHAHFATNPASVAMLCHLLGGPTYSFTLHGGDELAEARTLSVDQKVHHAAFAVGISEHGRAHMREVCHPADAERIEVVRCGVDPALLARPLVPLPERPRIVCVARLSAEKRHSLLLDACAELRAAGVAFELDLVGDGPLRNELEAKARALGIAARVRFLGWLSGDRVRETLEAGRISVLASATEGLPVVIMESLAAGRPAVATDVGAVGELVVNGRTGWIVPSGDLPRLTGALREALGASSATLERLGDQGRRLVAERHNAEREAASLAALFDLAGAL